MQHKVEPVGPHGIMEVIATLSAKGATGRLEILAGETKGALLFRGGGLVDARIGHLTGFQAVNAVVSMRDAQFDFDPSVAVPGISSITPSERVVLKRFFGIETADSQTADSMDHAAPAVVEAADETTVVMPPRRVRYAAIVAFGVLAIAVATAAVLLREKFRERASTAAVAARTESVEPLPAPVQPTVNEISRAEEESPATTPNATTGAPVQPTVNEAPRAEEKSPDTTPKLTGDTPNLTGEWNVVNTVNTTAYRSFKNLQIGFALSINQTGTTFTAKGRKVSENGRTLPARSRTPIELKGVINGDRVEATFYEEGTIRKTNGRFVWKIDRTGGGLTGTFASTAARTSGNSTATREL